MGSSHAEHFRQEDLGGVRCVRLALERRLRPAEWSHWTGWMGCLLSAVLSQTSGGRGQLLLVAQSGTEPSATALQLAGERSNGYWLRQAGRGSRAR